MTTSPPKHRHPVPSKGSLLASLGMALALVLGGAACGEGAAGDSCDSHDDCASSLQCLQDICVQRCEQHRDCGDGYNCTGSGLCEPVVSNIGDVCHSEWECGIGQSCHLDPLNTSSGSILVGSCQEQEVGRNVGDQCVTDADCRSNICSLGHCSEMCTADTDCPGSESDFSCQVIPHIVNESQTYFNGCLQSSGVLTTTHTLKSPSERLRIPVPSSAQSIAIVSRVEDENHLVGATRVVSPSGELLFSGSSTIEELVANPLRYLRSRQISTLLIPNSSAVQMEQGIYQVDIEASLPPFGPGTEIPEVEVFYKLDTKKTLDLSFYFLDLDNHPCSESFGSSTLDGETAQNPQSPFQSEYMSELRRLIEFKAGLDIGLVRYESLDRADLDAVEPSEVAELQQLADNSTGIAIFVVRSLSPDGIQALPGGIPGAPRSPGSAASGIIISADTLCYRDWDSLARVTMRTLAAHMGLWDNRDPEGIADPISDTDESRDNLMFFSEFGGTDLTDQQREVLRLFPGLR